METGTATTATIGSRTYRTEKGATNEAERSLGYAASGGSTIGVTEHDGGYVVVYFTTTTPERATYLLGAGMVLDAWL